MGKSSTRKFSWRAFASVLTGLSFIGMTFTGVILFVVPPGRIANWTGWTLLGLTKDQWIGLHDWFSIVFIIGAVVHIYLNWKPLLGYFKSNISKSFAFRTEWVLAVTVCAIAFFGTLAGVKPFSSLLAWNETIKYSWDTPERRAPIPHSELLTLAELADEIEDIDLDTMLANLESRGVSGATGESVVGELAEANNMTPRQLYDIALGQAGPGRRRGGNGAGRGAGGRDSGGSGAGGSGGGFGRITLSRYCADSQLDVSSALEKLKNAGFEAEPDMTMREIADTAGVHPSQIRTILESPTP